MSKPIKRVRIIKGENEHERIYGVSRALCWIKAEPQTIQGWFTDEIYTDRSQKYGMSPGARVVADTLFKNPIGVTKMVLSQYQFKLTKSFVFDWAELEPAILTAIAAGCFKDENLWDVEVQDHTDSMPSSSLLSSMIIGE